MRRSIPVVGLLVGLTGGCVRLASQTVFASMAQPVLSHAAQAWTARGFAPVGDIHIGTLNVHERDTVTFAFDSGGEYVAVGMCDEDCGDIDFHVVSPEGREIAFDVQDNARPVVLIKPKTPGTYRLEVVMLSCSTPPCYYGVELLRKTPGP